MVVVVEGERLVCVRTGIWWVEFKEVVVCGCSLVFLICVFLRVFMFVLVRLRFTVQVSAAAEADREDARECN